MIGRLYEILTGKPAISVRSATAEYGPPPGARWESQLSKLTDLELIAYGDKVVAELEASRRPAAVR